MVDKWSQWYGIGIVPGTDDDDLILIKSILFVDSWKSNYLDSSIGVIFSGDIDRMIGNLPYLPSNINNSTVCNIVSKGEVPFIGAVRQNNNVENIDILPPNECSFNRELITSKLKMWTLN